MDKRDSSRIYDWLRILKTSHEDRPKTGSRLLYDCTTACDDLDRIHVCATFHYSFLNMFKNIPSLPDRIHDILRITIGTPNGFGHGLPLSTYVQNGAMKV